MALTLIRAVVVGDSGVGKTSLIVRFQQDRFDLTNKSTLGVDYKVCTHSIVFFCVPKLFF
jgi:GTPase SAR1 family protein